MIFEYEHGDAKVKKDLHMLLNMATEGDNIITMEVSRLSRSTQQLCEIIEIIEIIRGKKAPADHRGKHHD